MAEKAANPGSIDFVLCIGQSNMAGRGGLREGDELPIDNVFLFSNEQVWVPAANPMNKYSTTRKSDDMQRLGPVWSFAKEYQSKTKKQLGLVVNARGGTSINEWQQGEKLYNEALIRTLQAQKHGVLIGILWHQGEGDKKRSAAYLPKFSDFATALRSDLGNENTPIILGEIGSWKAESYAINEVIRTVPEHIKNTLVVSSDSLTHIGDSLHFDRSAQVELGIRYAEALLEHDRNIQL